MDLGFSEMLFIFLLALIVLGPRKLPEIARQVGRIMGDIRRASNDFQAQIEDEVRKLDYEESEKKKTIEAGTPQIMPPGPQIVPIKEAVVRGSNDPEDDAVTEPKPAQEQNA